MFEVEVAVAHALHLPCPRGSSHVRSWSHLRGFGGYVSPWYVLVGMCRFWLVERLRENLADFVRNISRIQENLYQDVTCDLSI